MKELKEYKINKKEILLLGNQWKELHLDITKVQELWNIVNTMVDREDFPVKEDWDNPEYKDEYHKLFQLIQELRATEILKTGF